MCSHISYRLGRGQALVSLGHWWRRACWVLCSLLALISPGRADPTIAEVLDAPGLIWNSEGNGLQLQVHSEASDGVDFLEMTPSSELPISSLTTQVTGPAVVRFQIRLWDFSSDAEAYIGVDNCFIRLSDNLAAWTAMELQLGPGPHEIQWQARESVRIGLDQMSVTPGAGALTAAAGGEGLSWLVRSDQWIQDGDDPVGFTTGSAYSSNLPDYTSAVAVFAAESYVLDGWVKVNGKVFASYGRAMQEQFTLPAPNWQHFRALMPKGGMAFRLQPAILSSSAPLSDLRLAGFTARPATLGDALDAPEYPWTDSGSHWRFGGLEFSDNGSGVLLAQDFGNVTPSLTTQLTGPGRLFFTGAHFVNPVDHWRVAVGSVNEDFFPQIQGAWNRFSTPVPAGVNPVTISAHNVSQYSYPSFWLDEVTFCVPTPPVLSDALELPLSAELLSRQISLGLWSRTTTESHDGVDSLMLAAAPTPRHANLAWSNNGEKLGGLWLKAQPGTRFRLDSTSADGSLTSHFFAPIISNTWTWQPLFMGNESTRIHLCCLANADDGNPIYLDQLAYFDTQVPLASALDSTNNWVSTGATPLALPGSDAVGEQAVLLSIGTSIRTTASGPFKLKIRLRHTIMTNIYGYATLRINGTEIKVYPSTGGNWQETTEIYPDAKAGDSVEISHLGYPPFLLDTVELTPLPLVTLAEALDNPSFTSDTTWIGIGGVGRAGADVAVNRPLSNSSGPYASSSSMPFINPTPNASISGGFWWQRTQAYGTLTFAAAGSFPTPRKASIQGAAWQPIRFHFDQAPPSVSWELAFYSISTTELPTGFAQVDEFEWHSEPLMPMQAALETDQPGHQIGLGGWMALGEATARVQTADSHQGGDALEIQSTNGGNALQTTTLSTQISTGTDFSLWVKRSGGAGTLKLIVGEAPPIDIPLTAAWSEFRTLIPAAPTTENRPLELQATVPMDGHIFVDAVSLDSATDFNAALETTGLTWTSGGDVPSILTGNYLSAATNIASFYDGVVFQGLLPTQSAWVETTVNGPATVVMAGYHEGSGSRSELLVNGVISDFQHPESSRHFTLQSTIPLGSHLVRYRSSAMSASQSLYLHSVAVVAGNPADALPAALETLSAGRTWSTGGTRPPTPRYLLNEGVSQLQGLHFPPLNPGETSWVETSLTGSARAMFHYLCQTPASAFCLANGRKAVAAVSPVTLVPTILNLPNQAFDLRWEGSSTACALHSFTVTSPSPIAEIVSNEHSPPLIWVSPSFSEWVPAVDGPWYRLPESPNTGTPILRAAPSSQGSLWLTGPAVLSFELASLSGFELSLFLDSEAIPNSAASAAGQRWRQEGIIIPPGDHEVRFNISEDDNGDVARLKSFTLTTGNAYPAWASTHQLTAENSRPFQDANADGHANLLAYAFNRDPLATHSESLLTLTGTPGSLQLQLPTLPYDATGLKYEIQTSPDLQTWSTLTTVAANPPNQPGPLVPIPPVLTEKQFVRVKTKF